MISVISALLKGDDRIVEQFKAAKAFWDEFFAKHRNDGVDQLADALGNAQMSYEGIFAGDRYLAKSTMPTTALGSLYDERNGFEGNEELARRVVKAFAGSMVSIEVKGGALNKAAAIYWLSDELEQD
jgi:hypothetical protein